MVADQYEPPFDQVLRYDEFSVRVAEDDIPQLKDRLVAIPPAERQRLHDNIMRVQRIFRFEDPAQPYADQAGLTPFLMFHLWYKNILHKRF